MYQEITNFKTNYFLHNAILNLQMGIACFYISTSAQPFPLTARFTEIAQQIQVIALEHATKTKNNPINEQSH